MADLSELRKRREIIDRMHELCIDLFAPPSGYAYHGERLGPSATRRIMAPRSGAIMVEHKWCANNGKSLTVRCYTTFLNDDWDTNRGMQQRLDLARNKYGAAALAMKAEFQRECAHG